MASFVTLVNGIPTLQTEAAGVAIYDERLEVGSTISTGTPISLPGGETYEDDELEVRLNGQRLEAIVDYNYEGTIPRTQVSFTFDLIPGDDIDFRIDRVP